MSSFNTITEQDTIRDILANCASSREQFKLLYRYCRYRRNSCLVNLTKQLDKKMRDAIFCAFGW